MKTHSRRNNPHYNLIFTYWHQEPYCHFSIDIFSYMCVYVCFYEYIFFYEYTFNKYIYLVIEKSHDD